VEIVRFQALIYAWEIVRIFSHDPFGRGKILVVSPTLNFSSSSCPWENFRTFSHAQNFRIFNFDILDLASGRIEAIRQEKKSVGTSCVR